jgi:multidrug efflux pump subunit AcrA (membrane-fusion protein)
MAEHTGAPWLVYALAALCAGAIVAAILLVGPTAPAASTQSRVVTVAEGVVQSTVSGSGNLAPAVQLNLGFKTSGVVRDIYVSPGQQVTPGQLIAELNPKSAEVALEQARANLQSAEAALVQAEQSGGETSSAGSTSASGPTATSSSAETTTEASTTPRSRSTKPTSNGNPGAGSGKSAGSSATATPARSEKTTQSAATREANLASAKAAVRSDKLAVEGAEEAVSDTKLYAPSAGTIVSLSGEVGESVSATGTSKAPSTTASSSSASSSSGAGRAGASGASGSSSPSSSASSPFAVLADLSTMQLIVPLSESEIAHVHVGQPATITVEALEGLKLAAHVVSVSTLSTNNGGVVSYDVTFQLDQTGSGLKPGMSASAEVVVKQEEGVNVPTSAISAGSVTVVQNGKQTRRRVVTGLQGNSSTIILGGLRAGEQIALPLTSSSSSTSILSRIGARGGARGGLAPLGGGLGGGGLVFRGGG